MNYYKGDWMPDRIYQYQPKLLRGVSSWSWRIGFIIPSAHNFLLWAAMRHPTLWKSPSISTKKINWPSLNFLPWKGIKIDKLFDKKRNIFKLCIVSFLYNPVLILSICLVKNDEQCVLGRAHNSFGILKARHHLALQTMPKKQA